tara:strand:+ start:233 stop:442 length:210 start_codon:yes stop_codon:yes gene_type:complete
VLAHSLQDYLEGDLRVDYYLFHQFLLEAHRLHHLRQNLPVLRLHQYLDVLLRNRHQLLLNLFLTRDFQL